MKKIKLFITAFICLLAASCVDLDQNPLSYPSGAITYDKKAMEVYANGIFNEFIGTAWQYSNSIQLLNVGSDDMSTGTISKRYTDVDELRVTSARLNPDFNNLYIRMYKAIGAANSFITNVPANNTETVEVINPYMGEAYFFRALSYYTLVRYFGDVAALKDPLMEEDIYGNVGKGNVVRAKVADIYDQIIVPDLLLAIDLMKNMNDAGRSRDNTNTRPSKVAAQALLSEVYLTMAGWPLKRTDHYAKAKDLAGVILNENTHHDLLPNYSDLWKESTKTEDKEHIFALRHSTNYKSQYGKSYFLKEEGKLGWADMVADPYFYEAFPDDKRKAFNYVTSFTNTDDPANPVTKHYTEALMKSPGVNKYRDYGSILDGETLGITPMLRWADVLLTYAEAQNKADGSPNALAYTCLNKVRERGVGFGNPYNKAEGLSTQAFDKAVYDEKGWEFFCEFKRWSQLVRTETVKEANMKNPRVAASPTFNDGDKLYLMLLPTAEIETSGFTQNPK